MGVGAITTLKCEEFKGMNSAVTMPDAVKIMQPLRIIITFVQAPTLKSLSKAIKKA